MDTYVNNHLTLKQISTYFLQCCIEQSHEITAMNEIKKEKRQQIYTVILQILACY